MSELPASVRAGFRLCTCGAPDWGSNATCPRCGKALAPAPPRTPMAKGLKYGLIAVGVIFVFQIVISIAAFALMPQLLKTMPSRPVTTSDDSGK